MTKSKFKYNLKEVLIQYDDKIEIRSIIKKSYVDYSLDYIKTVKSSPLYGVDLIK